MAHPLLWHLPLSHYSEKARWAFDWKQVPHRRRVMPPGLQPLGGLLLTRGRGVTMPVLVDEGLALADSTDIVAWLEERAPERPLYPSDPAERARALEIEDWFDENAGPAARQWGFTVLLTEPEAMRQFAIKQTEWAPFPVPTAVFAPISNAFLGARYSIGSADGAERAWGDLVAALDRIEAELARGPGDFLVGSGFSVADLTAAALLYPLVLPPEGPWQAVRTAAFEELQSTVRERPAFRWVEETFRRYRYGEHPAARHASRAM